MHLSVVNSEKMVVETAQPVRTVQCTVVGDGMVGKTCLALAFARTTAPGDEDYVATVFENYAGRAHVNGDEYTVSIFDSAGQVSTLLCYIWFSFI